MNNSHFYLGEWQVSADTNTVTLGNSVRAIEPKAMDVLLLLCQHVGEVLSSDEIISSCWPGTDIGDNPVHKCITQIRKALNDKSSAPLFVETIRKRGYRVIADVVFPVDDTTRASQTTWSGVSPFVGLNAYGLNEADIFFGRQRQINRLVDTLTTQANQERAFTLILGPSGSGKSSLVHAGVLPKLMSAVPHSAVRVVSYSSIDFADINTAHIWIDLATHLLDWELTDEPVFANLSAYDLADKLAHDVTFICQRCESMLSEYSCAGNVASPQLLLVLDRLEVIFDSPHLNESIRKQFIDFIDQLARCNGVIIIAACRNDFYPQLSQYPALMEGKEFGAHFDLSTPSPAELSHIIRLPAIAAGLTWGTDEQSGVTLDDMLCDDAIEHPDALPLLQYTLHELYLQSDENELLPASYKALGGLEGAIGKKAEALISGLSDAHAAELESIFSLIFTVSIDTGKITSRTAKWSELSNSVQRDLVQAMVDNRLFVSHLQSQQRCFRVAHEALIRRWPRLRKWADEHKDKLEIKARLSAQTLAWINEDKHKAYLLADGKPLEDACVLRSKGIPALTADEHALVAASERQRHRRKRIRQGVVSVLSILTCLSVFLSWQSHHAYELALKKREEAEDLLGFMVGEFADKLRSVRRMDLLDGINDKALEYFTQDDVSEINEDWWPISKNQHSFDGAMQRARTVQAIAEVAYSRNQLVQAKESFNKAEQLLKSLSSKYLDNTEVLKEQGLNAFWRGQIAYDQLDYELARIAFSQYRHYASALTLINSKDSVAIRELIYANNSLAAVYVATDNYDKAYKTFSDSLETSQKLLEHDTQPTDFYVDLADTHSWLGKLGLQQGRIDIAAKHYSAADNILLRLLEDSPNNANVLENLLFLSLQATSLFELQRDLEKAKLTVERANQYVKQIVTQDSNNQAWQHYNTWIHVKREKIKAQSGEIPDRSSLDSLIGNIPLTQHHHPWVFLDLIEIYLMMRNFDTSESLVNELLEWLDSQQPLSSDLSYLKARTLVLSAHLFVSKNELASASLQCRAASQQLQERVHKTANLAHIKTFVEATRCGQAELDVSEYVAVLHQNKIPLRDVLTNPIWRSHE